MITVETLNELKARLEAEWDKQSIPIYFRETFRTTVYSLSRHKAVAIISRELEELKRKKSTIQAAIDAVNAREESLKNVKEMLEYFSKSSGWEKDEALCGEVIELLSAYRILTLNAVESIIKWKEQLVYALILNKHDSIGKHKTLVFEWGGENYIHKMRADLNFLFSSDFKKIFYFENEKDPLLIFPSKPSERKPVKANDQVKILNIPAMLQKRVKLAHNYIMDEDIEEQLNMAKIDHKTNKKALNIIYEELVDSHAEEVIKKLSTEIINEEKQKINEAAAKEIRNSIIEEFLSKDFKDLCKQTYTEATEPHIKKFIEGYIEQMIEKEINKTIEPIVKEEVQNAKLALKEQAKNQVKNKKEKDAAEKKRREDELALERKLAKEREENEKKRKADEVLKKKKDEENHNLAREIMESLLKELQVDIEIIVSFIYKEINDERLAKLKEKELKDLEEAKKREDEARRKEEEARKREELLKAQELKRLEDLKRQEELNKMDESKRKEELKRLEELKKEQELKRLAEEKALKELKKQEELKKKQEQDRINEQKRLEELKRKEELERQAELKRKQDQDRQAELKRKQELDLQAELKRKEDQKLKDQEQQKSLKAQQLMNSQIAENILRIIIDDEIKSLNLSQIAEQEIQKEIDKKRQSLKNDEERAKLAQKEKDFENQKISELLYNDLVDKFLEKITLDKVAEKMIERVGSFRNSITINTSIIKNTTFDPDDYAADEFTPGEHSPRQIFEESASHTNREESPTKIDELMYEFSDPHEFNSLNDLSWVPMKISEFSLETIFHEYQSNIAIAFTKVMPTIKQLLKETYKGIDPCWYWGLKQNKILGALVYSLDYMTDDRKIIVHHLSCINGDLMEQFIDSASSFLFEVDSCQEIRINMVIPFNSELPREIKKAFNSLKFKWKASADSGIQGCEMNVMGKVRESGVLANARKSELNSFSLKSGCLMEPSVSSVTSNNKTSEEMIQFGNRQCQINSVLNLFGKLDKSGITLTQDHHNRLQEEVSGILEIVNSTDSFNFPNIVSLVSENPQEATNFLKKFNFLDFTTTQKSSISVLDLKFKFISCTFIKHQVKASSYKFLRFKSPEVLVGSEFRIFSIPTSLQNIRAVFISYENLKEELESDLRREKTDLFYKVENLLKSVTYTQGETIEFSVPSFSKKVNWIINWMQGYEIPPQRDEKNSQFIKKCFETIQISTVAPEPAAGILNLEKSKGFVFENSFIFCLTHTGLDRVLDMPLFVCLVESQDWVLG